MLTSTLITSIMKKWVFEEKNSRPIHCDDRGKRWEEFQKEEKTMKKRTASNNAENKEGLWEEWEKSERKKETYRYWRLVSCCHGDIEIWLHVDFLPKCTLDVGSFLGRRQGNSMGSSDHEPVTKLSSLVQRFADAPIVILKNPTMNLQW